LPAVAFGELAASARRFEAWKIILTYLPVKEILRIEETVEHLFLDCELAKACWGKIGLTVDSSLNPLQIFQSFRLQLGVAFFMEVIIVMSWSIWTLRNDVIFRGIPASTLRGAEIFKDIFGLLLWRAKKKYFPAISSWLEQVV
jgi:hypothetical protein